MTHVKLRWEIESIESGQLMKKGVIEISSFVGALTYKSDEKNYASSLVSNQLVPSLGQACLKTVRILKDYSSSLEAADVGKDVTYDLLEVVTTLVSIVMMKDTIQENLEMYGMGEVTPLGKPGEVLLKTLATIAVSTSSNNGTPKGSSGNKKTPHASKGSSDKKGSVKGTSGGVKKGRGPSTVVESLLRTLAFRYMRCCKETGLIASKRKTKGISEGTQFCEKGFKLAVGGFKAEMCERLMHKKKYKKCIKVRWYDSADIVQMLNTTINNINAEIRKKGKKFIV
jgi:hypothetical protein